MEVMIFKTNIWGDRHEESLHSIFSTSGRVLSWSIDREDIDNVLRVIPSDKLTQHEVIQMVADKGFSCEVLE